MAEIAQLPVFIVDAFTRSNFSGNPAAVCLLNHPASDEWLQHVAAEFNLSETAFLLHEHDNRWNLRWFTPTCEVKLCGHATLAAAHVLSRELHFTFEELIFSSLSGDLKAKVGKEAITLDFPRITTERTEKVNALTKTLALDILGAYQAGDDIIVHVNSEAEVLAYTPEIDKIITIGTRGIILTAKSSNNERDFVSRFFAPSAGINEDPVTGSAHCSLGDFWSKQLGKNILCAEQISQRKGLLNIVVHDERVELIGQCVTFLKGSIGC